MRRHVDAVNVRETHRRRGAGEIDFLRARIARHLDNLLAGGAAHDGVIHQQHVFVAKFQRHRVQLLPHRLLAQLLPRHDEGAADIAVLHETLAVFHAKPRRQLNRRTAAGVRDGDDDVNIMRRPVAQNALGELLAHAQAGFVNIDAVDGRIRAGKIHILENARHPLRLRGALLVMHRAVCGNNERLARLQIAHDAKTLRLQRHRFTGNHVLRAAVLRLALAINNRADGKRIAEGHQTIVANHRHHRIRAAHPAVGSGDVVEDNFRRRPQLLLPLNLMRENIEQRLRIRMRVDMAQIAGINGADKLIGIGEIAVVRERDAVGRVHIKRLRLGRAGRARGRVAHMADAIIADEALHLALAENIAHETVVLVQKKTTVPVAGCDPGGILPAMLQNRQRIIKCLVYIRFSNDTHYAAHNFCSR